VFLKVEKEALARIVNLALQVKTYRVSVGITVIVGYDYAVV
jgi:hypothetical protein